MDESNKTMLRNRIAGFAYLLLAVIAVGFLIRYISGFDLPVFGLVIPEVLIGVCGILLLCLGKRDLTAVALLLFSMVFGYYTSTGGVIVSVATPVILIFFILLACALMLSKEKKASSYLCVFFPYGIGAISLSLGIAFSIFSVILHSIFGLVALMYGCMYLSGNTEKKLVRMLKSDEDFAFSSLAPVLGYAILMIPAAVYGVSVLTGLAGAETLKPLTVLCGACVLISALLVAVFSRCRAHAGVFGLAGVALILMGCGSGAVLFIAAGIFAATAIISLFVMDGKILNFLLFMAAGVLVLFSGLGVIHPVLQVGLAFLVVLLSFYLTITYLNRRCEMRRF